MATPFTEIYNRFLRDLEDPDMALIGREEAYEVCLGYLESAIALQFPQCVKDLTKYTLYNDGSGCGEFEADLELDEQEILAMAMRLNWLSGKIYNADLMERETGDRDFKSTSGVPILKQLSLMEEKLENRIHKYAVKYTYKNFSLEGW